MGKRPGNFSPSCQVDNPASVPMYFRVLFRFQNFLMGNQTPLQTLLNFPTMTQLHIVVFCILLLLCENVSCVSGVD